MKKILKWLAEITAIAALIGLIDLTIRGLQNGFGWLGLICAIGWGVVYSIVKNWIVDRLMELKKDIACLHAETKTLSEFICESEILKHELIGFGEDKFLSSDRHSYWDDYKADRYGREETKCNCSALTDRMNTLTGFYEFLTRDRLHNLYQPGISLTGFGGAIQSLKAETRKELLQGFAKLHDAEPKAFPKERLEWLIRGSDNEWQFRHYVDLLIPLLKRPSYGITSKEGKALISQLDRIAARQKQLPTN